MGRRTSRGDRSCRHESWPDLRGPPRSLGMPYLAGTAPPHHGRLRSKTLHVPKRPASAVYRGTGGMRDGFCQTASRCGRTIAAERAGCRQASPGKSGGDAKAAKREQAVRLLARIYGGPMPARFSRKCKPTEKNAGREGSDRQHFARTSRAKAAATPKSLNRQHSEPIQLHSAGHVRALRALSGNAVRRIQRLRRRSHNQRLAAHNAEATHLYPNTASLDSMRGRS